MTESIAPSEKRLIPISSLRLDAKTQTRAATSKKQIADIAQTIRQYGKDSIDPIDVFENDAGHLYVGDGFHRVGGHQKAGETEIWSNVLKGPQSDALRHSAIKNSKQSAERYTNADKENAVRLLCSDPANRECSNVLIAEWCGVADETVRKHRVPLRTLEGRPDTPSQVKRRDGKTYNVYTTEETERARAALEKRGIAVTKNSLTKTKNLLRVAPSVFEDWENERIATWKGALIQGGVEKPYRSGAKKNADDMKPNKRPSGERKKKAEAEAAHTAPKDVLGSAEAIIQQISNLQPEPFERTVWTCNTEKHTNPVLMGTQKKSIVLTKDILVSANRFSDYYDRNQLVAFMKHMAHRWEPDTFDRVLAALTGERSKR